MPTIVYTVQAGDTVYGIARRFGVTPQSIIADNQLANPDILAVGQRLLINVEETEPTPPPAGYQSYVVQPGDTLYSVARRSGTTVAELVRINRISDPNRIFPGQLLLLPPGAVPPGETVPPGYTRYIIQPGDTVYGLSRRFRTTVNAIVTANPGLDPNRLQIGQAILIPVRITPIAIYQGNASKRQVALTFDATYGDNQTESLLSTLAAAGVRSTWFISGIWAENFPSLLRAVAAAGHEIGNHSYSHPHMTQLSAAEMRDQILLAARAIETRISQRVNLFRPPFGEYNQTLLEVAAGLGYRVIMWTVDSLDWQNPGAQAVINRVLSNMKNGAIVLMHNASPDTVQALPTIIQEIRRRGFSMRTVSEVLDP